MSGAPQVVLTGFMGAGKPTVGRRLADMLEAQFSDLDAVIEAATGRSVAEIFAGSGEPEFRRLELDFLRRWLAVPPISARVLAVGGGAIEVAEFRQALAESGAAVYFLHASLGELLGRCRAQSEVLRPLLGEAELRFARRQPLYRQIGFPIDTSRAAADEVAQNILQHLEVHA